MLPRGASRAPGKGGSGLDRNVTLQAARPLRVVGADLLPGRGAAVTGHAVLAHEGRMGQGRRREGIEPGAAAQVLLKPGEAITSEFFLGE